MRAQDFPGCCGTEVEARRMRQTKDESHNHKCCPLGTRERRHARLHQAAKEELFYNARFDEQPNAGENNGNQQFGGAGMQSGKVCSSPTE